MSLMLLLTVFAAEAAAAPQNHVPASFDACVAAARSSAANVIELCDTKDIKIGLWGGENPAPACLEAMRRGPKVVEARKLLPEPILSSHIRLFEDQVTACLAPAPEPAPPPPVRETVKLWD